MTARNPALSGIQLDTVIITHPTNCGTVPIKIARLRPKASETDPANSPPINAPAGNKPLIASWMGKMYNTSIEAFEYTVCVLR